MGDYYKQNSKGREVKKIGRERLEGNWREIVREFKREKSKHSFINST